MWTLDRLREVAAERGETSGTPDFGKLLLAHERFRGRTEEAYPRDKAGRELHAMLDQQPAPLPVARAEEYPGLRQLREYAADRAMARAAAKLGNVAKSADPAEQPRAGPMAGLQAAREQERERG